MTALRSALRGSLRGPLRGALESRFGGGADPIAALFANGEAGAWYDMRQPVYSDVSATTEVSTNGDALAHIPDLSPNALHLTQPTSADRPTLAVSGALRSATRLTSGSQWIRNTAIDGLNGNWHSVIACSVAANSGWVFALSPNPPSVFQAGLRGNGSTGFWWYNNASVQTTIGNLNASTPVVLTLEFTNAELKVRQNGVDKTPIDPFDIPDTVSGLAWFSAYTSQSGSGGPHNIYFQMIREGQFASAAERATVERLAAEAIGITL